MPTIPSSRHAVSSHPLNNMFQSLSLQQRAEPALPSRAPSCAPLDPSPRSSLEPRKGRPATRAKPQRGATRDGDLRQLAFHNQMALGPQSFQPSRNNPGTSGSDGLGPLDLFSFSFSPQPLRTFDDFHHSSLPTLFDNSTNKALDDAQPVPVLNKAGIYLDRIGQDSLFVDVDPAKFEKRVRRDQAKIRERSNALFEDALEDATRDTLSEDEVYKRVEEVFVQRVMSGRPFEVVFDQLVANFGFDEKIAARGGALWLHMKQICENAVRGMA